MQPSLTEISPRMGDSCGHGLLVIQLVEENVDVPGEGVALDTLKEDASNIQLVAPAEERAVVDRNQKHRKDSIFFSNSI